MRGNLHVGEKEGLARLFNNSSTTRPKMKGQWSVSLDKFICTSFIVLRNLENIIKRRMKLISKGYFVILACFRYENKGGSASKTKFSHSFPQYPSIHPNNLSTYPLPFATISLRQTTSREAPTKSFSACWLM